MQKTVNNPYAKKLNEEVSISISRETMDYFREQSQRSGIPLQTLINACLTNVALKKVNFQIDDGE